MTLLWWVRVLMTILRNRVLNAILPDSVAFVLMDQAAEDDQKTWWVANLHQLHQQKPFKTILASPKYIQAAIDPALFDIAVRMYPTYYDGWRPGRYV